MKEKEIKFDCAECDETLTVLHDCKPKDEWPTTSDMLASQYDNSKGEEERLREILTNYGLLFPITTQMAIADILKEYKLRGGE